MTPPPPTAAGRRVAVVGGGIAGLATAHALITSGVHVTVHEAEPDVGGRIRSSPFAGVEQIDEAADAFLARVPEAVDLAHAVGLGGELVSPEPVGAAVWHDGLHDIPEGLLLGVPARVLPLARTSLLSWRGKARAALEPLLPRTSTASDSIGAYIRARFGDEVHERLVDALVGSIYATDTDRFSLAEVPQLHSLAERHRSLLLGARRGPAGGTGTASASPVFAAPRGGMGELVRAAARRITEAGGEVLTGSPVAELEPQGDRWTVDGRAYDAVVLATPATVAAQLLAVTAPDAATVLATAETADVAMVTLHVASQDWPARLQGRSGYLVPKPVQHDVTAVSFGSQKWAHWRPPAGGEILRVSLGRDGAPVLDFTDAELLERTLADLGRHLDLRLDPLAVRISRWPGAFAQYRPHHGRWVDEVERRLPPRVYVTGAAYRGIGIPACVRQGTTIAERCTAAVSALPE